MSGWRFRVLQDGVLVANGFGSESACRREASHYTMMYGQDGGAIKVTMHPPRKKQTPPTSD